jgi:hypothetical protein
MLVPDQNADQDGPALAAVRALATYDLFIGYQRKNASELAQLIRRELDDPRLHGFLS